jgi:hypothetical protein
MERVLSSESESTGVSKLDSICSSTTLGSSLGAGLGRFSACYTGLFFGCQG